MPNKRPDRATGLMKLSEATEVLGLIYISVHVHESNTVIDSAKHLKHIPRLEC